MYLKAQPDSSIRTLPKSVKTVKVKDRTDHLTELIVHMMSVEAGNESQAEMSEKAVAKPNGRKAIHEVFSVMTSLAVGKDDPVFLIHNCVGLNPVNQQVILNHLP